MNAAFGSSIGNQRQGYIGAGSGSAASPASASSGNNLETGSLDNGGYWEKYDDGYYWWYAEYDSSGNQIHYEEGYHSTFSMSMGLTVLEGYVEGLKAGHPALQEDNVQ